MALWTSRNSSGAGSAILTDCAPTIRLCLLASATPLAGPGIQTRPARPDSRRMGARPTAAPGRACSISMAAALSPARPKAIAPLSAGWWKRAERSAFAVRYRLAPECFFPAAVRDGIDAYRGLLAAGMPSGPICWRAMKRAAGWPLPWRWRRAMRGCDMPAGIAGAVALGRPVSVGLVDAAATARAIPRWTGKCCSTAPGIICANPIPATPMPRRPLPVSRIFRR